jgi:hypothetical protein
MRTNSYKEKPMKEKVFFIVFTALSVVLLLSQNTRAEAIAKLHRIRLGKHPGFTRLVFDSEGAKPLRIGPVAPKGLTLVYDRLEVAAKPGLVFRKTGGALRHVSLDREDGRAIVTITFKYPITRVRTFYLPGEPPAEGAYRLVLDFYPEGSAAAGPGKPVPLEKARSEQKSEPAITKVPEKPGSGPQSMRKKTRPFLKPTP